MLTLLNNRETSYTMESRSSQPRIFTHFPGHLGQKDVFTVKRRFHGQTTKRSTIIFLKVIGLSRVVVLDQAKQLTGLLVRVSRKLGHENFEKRAQKLKGNAYVHNVEPVHLYAVHSYKGRAEKGTHLRRRQQSLPRTLPVSRLQPAGLSRNFMHAGRRHIAHPAAAASFVPAAAAVAKNVKTQT